jgi:alpha-tubulin suppressor-like RCC1 family protein
LTTLPEPTPSLTRPAKCYGFNQVIYNETEEVFYAIGSGYAGKSADGIAWEIEEILQIIDGSNYFNLDGVSYYNNLYISELANKNGYFGLNQSCENRSLYSANLNNKLVVSGDGFSWTLIDVPQVPGSAANDASGWLVGNKNFFAYDSQALNYFYGKYLMVGVLSDPSQSQLFTSILTSINGETWETNNIPFVDVIGIKFEYFVAVFRAKVLNDSYVIAYLYGSSRETYLDPFVNFKYIGISSDLENWNFYDVSSKITANSIFINDSGITCATITPTIFPSLDPVDPIECNTEYYAWGNNQQFIIDQQSRYGTGQNTTNSYVPLKITGYQDWEKLVSSSDNTVFAIRDDKLHAWGYTSVLGNGSVLGEINKYTGTIQRIDSLDGLPPEPSPVYCAPITPLTPLTPSIVPKWHDIDSCVDYVVAIYSDTNQFDCQERKLYGWGIRPNQKVMVKEPVISYSEVLSELKNWKQVACGYNFNIAIRKNEANEGELYTWGVNNRGQLGNGNNNAYNNYVVVYEPTQIGVLDNWDLVTASIGYYTYALAINNDGELYAWGDNQYGQLGTGDYGFQNNKLVPTKVGNHSDWEYVSAGFNHTLGIRNGRLYAWGNNSNGQLGISDNYGQQFTSPQKVCTEFTDWIYVKAGYSQSFAIRENGTLYSCGFNNYCSLGLNSQANFCPQDINVRNTFEQVGSIAYGYLDKWKSVSTKISGTTYALNECGTDVGITPIAPNTPATPAIDCISPVSPAAPISAITTYGNTESFINYISDGDSTWNIDTTFHEGYLNPYNPGLRKLVAAGGGYYLANTFQEELGNDIYLTNKKYWFSTDGIYWTGLDGIFYENIILNNQEQCYGSCAAYGNDKFLIIIWKAEYIDPETAQIIPAYTKVYVSDSVFSWEKAPQNINDWTLTTLAEPPASATRPTKCYAFNQVVYNQEENAFYAIGSGYAGKSLNGITWQLEEILQIIPDKIFNLNRVSYYNNFYISELADKNGFYGNNYFCPNSNLTYSALLNNKLVVSDDGFDWSLISVPPVPGSEPNDASGWVIGNTNYFGDDNQPSNYFDGKRLMVGRLAAGTGIIGLLSTYVLKSTDNTNWTIYKIPFDDYVGAQYEYTISIFDVKVLDSYVISFLRVSVRAVINAPLVVVSCVGVSTDLENWDFYEVSTDVPYTDVKSVIFNLNLGIASAMPVPTVFPSLDPVDPIDCKAEYYAWGNNEVKLNDPSPFPDQSRYGTGENTTSYEVPAKITEYQDWNNIVSSYGSGDQPSGTVFAIRDDKLHAWGGTPILGNGGVLGASLGAYTGTIQRINSLDGDLDPPPMTPLAPSIVPRWHDIDSCNDYVIAIFSNTNQLEYQERKLYGWGKRPYQTKLLKEPEVFYPELLSELQNWEQVACGWNFNVAINEGELYTWGVNNRGQLGNDTYANVSTPTKIGDSTNWNAITAGISSNEPYALAINDNGELYAWGSNQYGQLGTNDYGFSNNKKVPTQVGEHNDWQYVSAGNYHTLGIRNGVLYAWGSNQYGQLGINKIGGNNVEGAPPLQEIG